MSEMYLFPIAVGKSTMLIDAKTLEIIELKNELVNSTFNIRRKDGSLAKKSIRIHRDSKLGLLASVNFNKNSVVDYRIIKSDKSDLLKMKVEANGSLDAQLLEVDMSQVISYLKTNKESINIYVTELAAEVLNRANIEWDSNKKELATESDSNNNNNEKSTVEAKVENPEKSSDIGEILSRLMKLTLENDKLQKEKELLEAELKSTNERLNESIKICNNLDDTEVLRVEDVYTFDDDTKPIRVDKYFAETTLKTMRRFDRHTFEYEDYMYFNEIKCFPAYSSSFDGKSYEQIVQLKVPGNTIESLLALVVVDGTNPVSVTALDRFKKYEVTNELLRRLDMSYRRYRTSAVNEAVRSFS